MVKDVLPGTAAAESGAVRPNDQIIEVRDDTSSLRASLSPWLPDLPAATQHISVYSCMRPDVRLAASQNAHICSSLRGH